MTTRRLTQQSRRQLESADVVRVRMLNHRPDSGYGLEIFKMEGNDLRYFGHAASSQGPMEYPTPGAAIRALRRIRPDMLDADVPIVYQPRAADAPPAAQEPRDARAGAQPDVRAAPRGPSEHIIDQLRELQAQAEKLMSRLDDIPQGHPKPYAQASAILSGLARLESDLLEDS